MKRRDGSTLATRAYEHIRAQVLNGAHPAGTRLVTRQIAKEVGVSLNPVREALGRLAAEGLIEHLAGVGASVRTVDARDVIELYELRQAIEPFAARKAAGSISEGELLLLDQYCAEQRSLAATLADGGELQGPALARWHQLEELFHESVLHASRNRQFERTLRSTRTLTRIFEAHRQMRVRVDYKVAAETAREHAELVQALRDRDGDRAAECMMASLREGMRNVVGGVR